MIINKLCVEHDILVDRISGQFRDRQNICDTHQSRCRRRRRRERRLRPFLYRVHASSWTPWNHGHVLRCPRRIGLASCRRPALIWRCSFTRSSDVHKMWPAQQSNIVNFDHRRRLKRALYEYLAAVVQCARPKRRPPGGMAAGVSADDFFFAHIAHFDKFSIF